MLTNQFRHATPRLGIAIVAFGVYLVGKFYLQVMGFWTLLEGLLLLANAFAVLNEDRFLAPKGWSLSEAPPGGAKMSLKGRIIGLIYATQYLRVPLILLNSIFIIVKLVSG